MSALGSIFEAEPNAVQRIIHWGPLVILHHTFAATPTRIVGKAMSRLLLSFTSKGDVNLN